MKKVLLFTTVLALTLSTQQAFAATVTWTGATSTDWATATNWDIGVPLAGDEVIIPDATANPLILTSVTPILLSFSTSAAVTLTINSGGHLIVGIVGMIGEAGVLSLLGTTTINTGGQLTVQGSIYHTSILGNLTVNTGGMINIKWLAQLVFDQVLPNKAINYGTIFVEDYGTLSPNTALENYGTIDMTGYLDPNPLYSGSILLNTSTGIINHTGNIYIYAPQSITNDGIINSAGFISNDGIINNTATYLGITNYSYSGTGDFINSTNTGTVLNATVADCINFTKFTLLSSANTHFNLNTGATACTDFDQIAIGDLATLDGSFTASGTVTEGDVFVVMTFGSKTGTFTNSSTNMGGGLFANISYSATQATITIASSVLSVELLDFKGPPQYNGNLLTWTTANEVNNKGFQVERAPQPPKGAFDKWDILGFVNAKGKAAHYEFLDVAPPSGAGGAYYRLRQLDNDGKETLSKVVSISNKSNTKLKAYPNPVSNILTVETTEQGDFQILNLLGQEVLTGKTPPSGAGGLDVSALPQGAYFLKVGAEQVKFVKQ